MSKVTVNTNYKGQDIEAKINGMPWIAKILIPLSKLNVVLQEVKKPEPKEDEPQKLDVQSGGLYFCDKKHCRFYTEHKDGLAIHKSRMHRG